MGTSEGEGVPPKYPPNPKDELVSLFCELVTLFCQLVRPGRELVRPFCQLVLFRAEPVHLFYELDHLGGKQVRFEDQLFVPSFEGEVSPIIQS